MNLFVRYFEHETLASNMDEVMAFLDSLEEVNYDANDIKKVDEYLHSANDYPFRMKVTFSNYILFLKTPFETMEEFKENERLRKEQKAAGLSPSADRKKQILDFLNETHIGWYDATIIFKRVLLIPGTTKFQYKDATFRVKLKANSGMHCYDRIIEYLHNRQDLDPRCQYPSAKSDKFMFDFLGDEPNPAPTVVDPAQELVPAETPAPDSLPDQTLQE